SISQDDQEAVLNALGVIKEKLPFLISLTPDEIQSIPKMGTSNQTFVDKAVEVAAQNPDIMPKGFDLEEMRKDADAFRALTGIRLAVAQLLEQLDNTQLLVGSEAYSAALAVYLQTKTTGKGKGLETAADELGRRFVRKIKGKKNDSQSPSK